MTNINLLPWRESKREQDTRRFAFNLAATLAMLLLLIVMVHVALMIQVGHQTDRNKRLENEIAEVKKQIIEIKDLEIKRLSLIERMRHVQKLQSTRALTVRLFDELIRILPNGVFVTRMDRVGDKITLLGSTESNSNISILMRNIEASQWIQLPQLTEIKKLSKIKGDGASEFKLSFILKPKGISR